MKYSKSIVVAAAAFSLLGSMGAMAETKSGTTLGGGSNTQMKGGGNKDESGMQKHSGAMSGAKTTGSGGASGSGTTLAGGQKGNKQ